MQDSFPLVYAEEKRQVTRKDSGTTLNTDEILPMMNEKYHTIYWSSDGSNAACCLCRVCHPFHGQQPFRKYTCRDSG
jgi:hypothetical protein